MAIMNPMTAVEYDSIPDNVRDAIRAVILNESDDATERLIAIAADMAKRKEAEKAAEKGNAGQHTATNTGSDTAQKEEDDTVDADIQALVDERQEARKAKNFARADEIRDLLKEKGITLKDTPQGVQIIKE